MDVDLSGAELHARTDEAIEESRLRRRERAAISVRVQEETEETRAAGDEGRALMAAAKRLVAENFRPVWQW